MKNEKSVHTFKSMAELSALLDQFVAVRERSKTQHSYSVTSYTPDDNAPNTTWVFDTDTANIRAAADECEDIHRVVVVRIARVR